MRGAERSGAERRAVPPTLSPPAKGRPPARATFRAGGGCEVWPCRRGGAVRRNQWLGSAV